MQYSTTAYRIAFSLIQPMNIALATAIFGRIDSEQEFFELDASVLLSTLHVSSKIASRQYRDQLLQRAVAEEEFALRNGVRCLYFKDRDFPQRLKACDDAPVLLYVLGNTELNEVSPLAIVGTRNATHYGVGITENLVAEIAGCVQNPLIVSGLAYGIDIAAHRAAMQKDVPTVAVMATPINTIYPADHRDYAARIIKHGGALITEYPTGTTVHRGYFLARNRLVAGLCDAVAVIESKQRGGALTTANIALAYNREVYACPGRLTDKYSTGCNRLIATNTARILTDAQSMAADLHWPFRPAEGAQMQLDMPVQMTQEQQRILNAIEDNPQFTINELLTVIDTTYASLNVALMEMEMENLIIRLPGGRFAPVQSST